MSDTKRLEVVFKSS